MDGNSQSIPFSLFWREEWNLTRSGCFWERARSRLEVPMLFPSREWYSNPPHLLRDQALGLGERKRRPARFLKLKFAPKNDDKVLWRVKKGWPPQPADPSHPNPWGVRVKPPSLPFQLNPNPAGGQVFFSFRLTSLPSYSSRDDSDSPSGTKTAVDTPLPIISEQKKPCLLMPDLMQAQLQFCRVNSDI